MHLAGLEPAKNADADAETADGTTKRLSKYPIDLAEVAASWDLLPSDTRAAVLAIVRSAFRLRGGIQ